MRRRVAVVGGGIAGLAVAARLDPSRFDVTVYEATPHRAAGGSALGIWPSAARALRTLGIFEQVRATGWYVRGGAVRDLHGRRPIRTRGVALLMVDRAALLAALESAVPAAVRRVTARVTEPDWLDAGLVVGADGVGSQVRALVRGRSGQSEDRRATPWIALRGLVAGSPRPEHVGEYWGPGRLFGIAPVGGMRTYWFSAQASRLGGEPLDPAEVVDEARALFADAAPAIRDLLAVAGPEVLANRLWVAPPMARYARGRYVVIGDAAHAMTPNLGRGACEALLDGVSLASTLDRGGSLVGWQARRVPPTQTARIASELLMRVALRQRRAADPCRSSEPATLRRSGRSRAP